MGDPRALAVPCLGCGYDVRGVALDGVCAECGLPVEASATLAARWPASRQRALRWLVFAVGVALATYALTALAVCVAIAERSFDSVMLGIAASLAFGIAHSLAVWWAGELALAVHRRHGERREPYGWRVIARWMPVVAVVAVIASFAAIWFALLTTNVLVSVAATSLALIAILAARTAALLVAFAQLRASARDLGRRGEGVLFAAQWCVGGELLLWTLAFALTASDLHSAPEGYPAALFVGVMTVVVGGVGLAEFIRSRPRSDRPSVGHSGGGA